MSPPPSDNEIDYLLSRGKLGGSQRQRILDAALAASRNGFWARWRGRLAWSAGGLTLATAAAVLLLVVRTPPDDAASLRPKGAGDAPVITVACLGATLDACPAGSRVAFALDGGRDEGGFVTSYADPVATGERVWYLNNEPVGAPAEGSSRRVLPKGILIGDGQPAGAYKVHTIFSRRPIAREELATVAPVDVVARAELDLVVSP